MTKPRAKPTAREVTQDLTGPSLTAYVGGLEYDTREFFRMPRNRERDEVYQLSRSTWYNLAVPGKANKFKPLIKSISLRRPGAIRGVRLISASSAAAYFRRLLEEQEAAQLSQREKNATQPDLVDREGPLP